MQQEVVIEFINVTLSHQGQPVLTDISFNVKSGEFVYLIGKVGSGKTTLIRAINADVEIDNGEAIVTGFNLKKISRNKIPYLRRRLGVVFQDFQLLTDRSVYNNMLFVLKATGWDNKIKIDERITSVLDIVGQSHNMHKMPHQLSGGEQQKIVIARALLNDPDIIIADEPTANLDPETSEEIVQLLYKISQSDRAVLMATHNYLFLKKYTGRIFRFTEQKMTEITDISTYIENQA